MPKRTTKAQKTDSQSKAPSEHKRKAKERSDKNVEQAVLPDKPSKRDNGVNEPEWWQKYYLNHIM